MATGATRTIITTTTTTGGGPSSTFMQFSTDYLMTIPGFLKLLQLIFHVICVILIAWNYEKGNKLGVPDLFYLMMVVTFMIGTTCLLASCMLSNSTIAIISKTIYEFIYHAIAGFFLFFVADIMLINLSDYQMHDFHTPYMVASIIGVLNGGLYGVSAFLGYKSFKGPTYW